MKIYNKVKVDMNTGEILAEDSFEYDGPLALACDLDGIIVEKTERGDGYFPEEKPDDCKEDDVIIFNENYLEEYKGPKKGDS